MQTFLTSIATVAFIAVGILLHQSTIEGSVVHDYFACNQIKDVSEEIWEMKQAGEKQGEVVTYLRSAYPDIPTTTPIATVIDRALSQAFKERKRDNAAMNERAKVVFIERIHERCVARNTPEVIQEQKEYQAEIDRYQKAYEPWNYYK